MPVVISPSAAQNTQDMPMTHARIGYHSVVQLQTTTVTATSELPDFGVGSLKRYATYERWKAANSDDATISITAEAAVDCDYVGIAAHNLGSVGATVTVEYSVDGLDWLAIDAVELSDNRALMILFSQTSAQFWRVRLTGMTDAPSIGVLFLGRALAMQRPIYQGHSPINLSRQTTMRPSISEGGQWLGRTIMRRGLKTRYNWSNLSAAWYRSAFDPFVEAARVQPFFIAWRPATFVNEVAYCWTDGDIQPNNSGPRDLMSVSISVTGYDEA